MQWGGYQLSEQVTIKWLHSQPLMGKSAVRIPVGGLPAAFCPYCSSVSLSCPVSP